MVWISRTMNTRPGTEPVPGAMCETEMIGKMGSTRRTTVEAASCYCPYCRNLVSAAQPRNISPLAAIDLYSLPDQTDVQPAEDRSH
jgi:hypothetical protein